MKAPEKILIIRLSSVGDIVLSVPVAERLRKLYPQSRITCLVDSGYETLASLFPAVDEVVVFEHLARHRGPSGIGRLARELGYFDLVVDLQHKLRTALLCSLLKPGRRLSMVKRRGMDLVRAIVGKDAILRGPHQVTRNLSVLGEDMLQGLALDGVAVPAEVPEMILARKLVDETGSEFKARFAQRPVVGIIPDARHFTKNWPYGHLKIFVRMCLDRGYGVVLLGGRYGSAGIEFVTASVSHENLLCIQGEDLEHLAVRISACSVLVSPDSGPAHIAGVLGVPSLVLFGSTSAERWAPMGPRVEILNLNLPCSPCSNHGSNSCPLGTVDCMALLKPEMVLDVLERMLGK